MPKTPKRAGLVARPGSRFLSEVIASNVRAYRRRRDLTQDELANRMEALAHGWVRATVSEVERNGRSVSVDELAALAVCLGASVGELMDPAGPDLDHSEWLDLGESLEVLPTGIASQWLRNRSRLSVEFDESGMPSGEIVSRPIDEAAAEEYFGKFVTNEERS